MKDSRRISTPTTSNVMIDKYENVVDIDITMYRCIIISLLFLTTSKPNIMFSVCVRARYLTSLKESRFKIVKRILRYLNGTFQHGLWYPKGSASSLVSFF